MIHQPNQDKHLVMFQERNKTYSVLLDDRDDVLAIPKEHMGNRSTDGKVSANFGKDLRTCEPWQTLDRFQICKPHVSQ